MLCLVSSNRAPIILVGHLPPTPPWSDFFVDKPTGWAKAGTGAEQAPVKALNKRALNKRWCESAEQARAEQALM